MALDFSCIEKNYVLLINHPDLLKRAKELGYENAILFTRDGFDENDIKYCESQKKAIVRISFVDDAKWHSQLGRSNLGDTDIRCAIIELPANSSHKRTSEIRLKDAIDEFPSVDDLEKELKEACIIPEDDYTDRCGNCHEYLGKDDKYCRYCGTERGKGHYQPFMNESYCVYGPPVKIKYKCSACGHIWITGRLGGDNSKYCPQCGNERISILEHKALDWFSDAIAFEEPYDKGEEPILLEEKQIEQLLDQRKKFFKGIKKDDEWLVGVEETLRAMRKAGIDVPKEADQGDYPRTEKEAEQINQAKAVLMLKGHNLKACKGITCEHCGSDCIATLGYTIQGKNSKKIAENVHISAGKDALVYPGYGLIYSDNHYTDDAVYHAYFCLSCGNTFGNMDVSRGFVEEHKKLSKKEGVKKERMEDKNKDTEKSRKKENKEKPKWYGLGYLGDSSESWGEENQRILDMAKELDIDSGYWQIQGCRTIYAYCYKEEAEKLINALGKDLHAYWELDKLQINAIKKIHNPKKKENVSDDDQKESKKGSKLDEMLSEAISEYNMAYTSLNDHGTQLFNQRERSTDLLDNVETLINSIANHPKEFDATIAEINVSKKDFRDVCQFAKDELEAAKKSALSAGAGAAGGIAVASLAPSAAMWVATTFGTASTGTAISTLSGAAATKAALAWLGGGALTSGGGGIAAGQALLAMAGPIGWSIAGATLLTSIVLFANKKIKLDKERKDEIEKIKTNTEQLRETDAKLDAILEKTIAIRSGLAEQYTSGMPYFGKNFVELSEEAQLNLGAIVNNAKALAFSLNESV